MDYPTFKQKWLGKRVDYDGVYQYQCVDLVKQYMAECFNMKPGAWGNAIDYWNNTNPNVLKVFNKVASSHAIQGDIVIFYGNTGNPYGHIGIADTTSSTHILTLEQNGSTGNGSGTGGDAIRTRWIGRDRVAGLLRPKGEPPMTKEEEANAYRIVLERPMEHAGSGRTGYQFIVQAEPELKAKRAGTESVMKQLIKERDDARTQVAKLQAEVLGLRDQITKLELEKQTLEGELATAKKACEELIAQKEAQIAELGQAIQIKDNEITRLTNELQACHKHNDCANASAWELFKMAIIKAIQSLKGQ